MFQPRENMIKYESTIALPKKIDFNKIILKMTGKAKLFWVFLGVTTHAVPQSWGLGYLPQKNGDQPIKIYSKATVLRGFRVTKNI